jgi:hypothetical protein
MYVQIAHVVIGKETPDVVLKFAAIHDLCANQHGSRIVSANGQKAMPEHGRDFLWCWARCPYTAANEDWPGCPIWRGDVVMGERKKQNGLTNLGVGEADPTWETRRLIGNHSASAHCLQLCVAPVE